MQKIMHEEPTFFAFGSGHLGGEKGLISLLESQGYIIRPIYGRSLPSELATKKTDREYLESGNQKANNNDNLLGALEDYNRSLALNPKSAEAYFRRGIVKEELFDNSGALADYNKAVSIDGKYDYHEQRGLLKHDRLKYFLGAVEDFNQCIKIQPNRITPYYRRGLIRSEELGDFSGALSDFNMAININPQSLRTHLARGVLRFNKLNDRAGGIADVKRAIMFAKFYNDINFIDKAQAVLKVMEGRR
jgi:tetratricopeptide (TPR) repeat protein